MWHMQEGEAQHDVVRLPPDLRAGTARVSAQKETLCRCRLVSFCESVELNDFDSLKEPKKQKQKRESTRS